MRLLHFRVGLAFLLVFLATGVFMAVTFEDRTDHDVRMLRRSAHVYLLMAALANLLMGAFHQWREPGRFQRIQLIGSIFLLLSPFGFLAAFFMEPAPELTFRPISVISVFLVALGVVFLTYGQIKLNSRLANPKKTRNTNLE